VGVIAGLGLTAGAIASDLGHWNTAAHLTAYTLSLLGYFQALAMVGSTAVSMPPIVEAWTQNFQWSMGIIRIEFLQTVATWYQRATGGTSSTVLSSLSMQSVQLQKRSMDSGVASAGQSVTNHLSQRATTTSTVVVSGLQRVAFLTNIESTNLFLTAVMTLLSLVVIIALCSSLLKITCEIITKKTNSSEKFLDFRNGWKEIMKGMIFRVIMVSWPPICVLCLWELMTRDSIAEVINAILILGGIATILLWGAFKVVRMTKYSVSINKNAAYIFSSDPKSQNKWGHLYVQYKVTKYYFIPIMLGYVLLKSIFIAFAQKWGLAQAVALLIIEAVLLVGVSIKKPWMDKKTNILNISIASINFLNAIFFLMFTEVFKQPVITIILRGEKGTRRSSSSVG
jgi:hypothetical protein